MQLQAPISHIVPTGLRDLGDGPVMGGEFVVGETQTGNHTERKKDDGKIIIRLMMEYHDAE
jgi:hypothetical protein